MYLESIYSSQKSFSKKAEVITEGAETKLKSYHTIVAVKQGKTTAIHINEFLQQNGVSKLNKKQMEEQPLIQL